MRKWALVILVAMVVCHLATCCFSQEEIGGGILKVSGKITTLDIANNKLTMKDKQDKVFEFIWHTGFTMWKCEDSSGGSGDEVQPKYLAVGMDINVEYAERDDGKLQASWVEIPFVEQTASK